MSNESENKLARRVDDKRAEVPLQWNESVGVDTTPAVEAAAGKQPEQREVPEYTGLDTIARVFADAADANGKVVLSAQSCDLLYRAMTTPIVTPVDNGVPSDRAVEAAEAQLYRDLTGDATKLGYDGIPAALEALRTAGAAKGGITSLEGLTRYDYVPGETGRMIIGQDDNGPYVLLDDVRSLLASSAGEQAEPVMVEGGTSEQQARYAIDGAIQYGRENRNPPPSTDHWLYEYWNIGRQLAKLGETGWDNVTPAQAAPAAPEPVLYARRIDLDLVTNKPVVVGKYVDEDWNVPLYLASPIAAAPAAEEVRDTALYTCVGKGGEYELIGHVAGAGPLKGSWMVVYRDVSTGDLYFRSPGDFDKRMQRLDADMKRAASTEGGAA